MEDVKQLSIIQEVKIINALQVIIDAQYDRGGTLAALNNRIREAKDLLEQFDKKS